MWIKDYAVVAFTCDAVGAILIVAGNFSDKVIDALKIARFKHGLLFEIE
jgi:hypothetical protein